MCHWSGAASPKGRLSIRPHDLGSVRLQTPLMTRSLAVLAPLTLVAGLMSGCGIAPTTEIIGMAAVTVDHDGNPVLLVRVCKDSIDTVSIFAQRDGLSADEPNPVVASWTSDRAVGGTIEVPVQRPPVGWTPDPSTPDSPSFSQGKGYIVLAGSSQQDAEVTQVSFRGGDLRGLTADQVLVRHSHTWSRQAFARDACRDRG